ncbi:hypothetical protein FB645_002644 [Coemansia sp. IMI 203386]|nr:hypothetical protein FB645_002644 [Coemansia sp. IMI 203386]
MASSFVVAFVGKPSAGKSSFLNAITDASAKVGNFPFTTIKPNEGVAYFPLDCPCKQHGVSDRCKPRHGRCQEGRRFVPVRMMDVAGLVPGASEGRGLGNRFLDDLRHADVLVHVVDASGMTDDQGKETKGYDPIDDVRWLRHEIEEWVAGNMLVKWANSVRRHLATKSHAVDTLHGLVAGYGARKEVVQRALDRLNSAGGGSSRDIGEWDEADVRRFVAVFLDLRFPTVVALNKIDMPDADKNIAAIMRRYKSVPGSVALIDGVSDRNIVLSSALAECFLRKMAKQGFIRYETGDDDFATHQEDASLKPMDEKMSRRLENIRDLVLFRYGSTGVQETVCRAVDVLGYVPVYPVKSVANFGASSGDNTSSSAAFQDCVLVKPGTTVREFAKKLHSVAIDKGYAGAETVGNIQLAEDDVIVPGKNNIIKYFVSSA